MAGIQARVSDSARSEDVFHHILYGWICNECCDMSIQSIFHNIVEDKWYITILLTD